MAMIRFTGGVNNALRVQDWEKTLWHTHQRDQFWTDFSGTGTNNVIQNKMDFTKRAGYQMTEGLIMPFVGAGIAGDAVLEDSEENPDFYSMTWTISQIRNAGRYAGEETVQQVHYDLPTEIKDGLGDWMSNRRDDDIFTAIGTSPTKIYYVNDRANTAAVLATDLMTLAQWTRGHTYAKTADPVLPPLKIIGKGKKTVYRYMGVMHDHVSYDLRVNDGNYQTVVSAADPRGDSNRMFNGALIDWQGMVLYEHNGCPIYTTWGAAGAVAGAESYLCGRQACIVGVGGYRMRTGKNGYIKLVEKRFDYQNQYGVAIGMIKGEAKATYNSKDFSVVALRSARTNIS